MEAKDELAKLDGLYAQGKIDQRIVQTDHNFQMQVEEKLYSGTRQIIHYFKNQELIYTCTHFKDNQNEFIEILDAIEDADDTIKTTVYSNFK